MEDTSFPTLQDLLIQAEEMAKLMTSQRHMTVCTDRDGRTCGLYQTYEPFYESIIELYDSAVTLRAMNTDLYVLDGDEYLNWIDLRVK